MKRILSLVLGLTLLMSIGATALAEGTTAEIEFYCIKEEVQDVMQSIIDLFEAENPGWKVNLTYNSDGTTVLRTRISTGDVPDIMMLYPAESTYRAFYDEGYIVDLAGYEFMLNVDESMLALNDYNGVQIAIPYTLSTYGIFYNKDIFAKLGLSVPTTLDDLLACCKVIKEAGYDAFTLPLQNGTNQITERLLGAFNPDTYLDFQAVAAGDKDIEEVGSLTALADIILGIKPYSTADAMGLGGTGATADFCNGVAAMRFNGSWFLSSILAANPDANVGMFGIPSPVTNDVIVPVNIDTGFSMSASCKYPEVAEAFMAFLTRQDVATMYYGVDGNINMIKGVAYDKAQMMDVYNTVMSGKMSITQINLWGANATNVRTDLGAAVQTVYMDEDMAAYYEMCEAAIVDNMK